MSRTTGAGALGEFTAECPTPGLMEAFNPRRMEVMAAPREYPDDMRERAIRFAVDLVEGPEKLSACRSEVPCEPAPSYRCRRFVDVYARGGGVLR
jgi:hypothetical protein